MAEQDNSQEKTLDPTQKRLEKAREDGDILSSKEMFVFGSSFMGLIVIASNAPSTNIIGKFQFICNSNPIISFDVGGFLCLYTSSS